MSGAGASPKKKLSWDGCGSAAGCCWPLVDAIASRRPSKETQSTGMSHCVRGEAATNAG